MLLLFALNLIYQLIWGALKGFEFQIHSWVQYLSLLFMIFLCFWQCDFYITFIVFLRTSCHTCKLIFLVYIMNDFNDLWQCFRIFSVQFVPRLLANFFFILKVLDFCGFSMYLICNSMDSLNLSLLSLHLIFLLLLSFFTKQNF